MDQQQQPLPWSARWRSIWRELSQRRQIAPHRENHLQLALLHVAAWTPTKHAATATSPLAGPARHQGGGGYVFQHVILSRCSYQLLPGLSRGFVASRCPLVVQLKGDAAADFNLPPPLGSTELHIMHSDLPTSIHFPQLPSRTASKRCTDRRLKSAVLSCTRAAA